jgi:hypothetical protein
MRIVLATLLFVVALRNAQATTAPKPARLTVSHEAFVLTMPDGKQLRTRNLIGATLDMTTPDGAEIALRIDGAHPAKERPSLILLDMSVRVGAKRMPFCEKDYYGRAAGFPVSGAWSANGRFIADPNRWFITCTSGSQGKCILFGYDPWSKGPHGEDLIPYYEACQHMVRADYDGSRWAHTKNGTPIDIWDHIGIQYPDGSGDTSFRFEAGWSPRGAVCVSKTRWADLLARDDLMKSAPALDGPCDEAVAAAKGALLFNRSR